MIVMETRLQENPDDLLPPKLAAAYLGKLWNRPFTPRDFTNLRINRTLPIEPAYEDPHLTLWRRASLKHMAETMEPPKFRPELRKPRKRKMADNDPQD